MAFLIGILLWLIGTLILRHFWYIQHDYGVSICKRKNGYNRKLSDRDCNFTLYLAWYLGITFFQFFNLCLLKKTFCLGALFRILCYIDIFYYCLFDSVVFPLSRIHLKRFEKSFACDCVSQYGFPFEAYCIIFYPYRSFHAVYFLNCFKIESNTSMSKPLCTTSTFL